MASDVSRTKLFPVPTNFKDLRSFHRWVQMSGYEIQLPDVLDLSNARKIVKLLLRIYHPDKNRLDDNASEYTKRLNAFKDFIDKYDDETESWSDDDLWSSHSAADSRRQAAEAESRRQAAEAESRHRAAEAETRRQTAEAESKRRAAEAESRRRVIEENRRKPKSFCKYSHKPGGCKNPMCSYAHADTEIHIPEHILGNYDATNDYIHMQLKAHRDASEKVKIAKEELYNTSHIIRGTSMTFQICPDGIKVFGANGCILETHTFTAANAKNSPCKFGCACSRKVCGFRHPFEDDGMFHLILQGHKIRLKWMQYCLTSISSIRFFWWEQIF